MTHRKRKKLFFAGTDTEVGKTYVASLIAQRLHLDGSKVGVYKPVASGCVEQDGERIAEDAVALWQAAGSPRTLNEVCPQRFLAPLAPPEAAVAEGSEVNVDQLFGGGQVWLDGFDVTIVEGAGGLFSPLAEGVLNLDLAIQFEADLIVVAANRLGVIHQVVSTCRAAMYHGVTPAGIILNRVTDEDDLSVDGNAAQIAKYCDIPILESFSYGAKVEAVQGVESFLAD